MATRIEERFTFTGGKVDRSGAYPVVRDVLLCGPVSANKRRYLKAAFEGDRVKRYNDRPAFLNHGTGRDARRYEDKVATIENARVRADGMPVGDLAVNPKHPFAEALLFDAEHKPGSVGMSHVAHCETRVASDGWVEVTELVEAESVDVVVGPATTKGLYEQRGNGVPHTIKTLTEWLTRHPKSTAEQVVRGKRFLEFDVGMADMPVADAPAEDAEPEEGLAAAFKTYLHAHVDELAGESMTIDDFLKKVKDAYKAYAGKPEKKGGDGEAETETEKPAEEQARRAAADLPYTILAECQAKNYAPGTATLKALAAMTPADRAAFITEQAAAQPNAERIRSAQRRPGAGSAGTPPAGTKTETVEEQRLIPAWN